MAETVSPGHFKDIPSPFIQGRKLQLSMNSSAPSSLLISNEAQVMIALPADYYYSITSYPIFPTLVYVLHIFLEFYYSDYESWISIICITWELVTKKEKNLKPLYRPTG
jgi:hypothetical protein